MLPYSLFSMDWKQLILSTLKSDHVTSLHPNTQPPLASVSLGVKVLQWLAGPARATPFPSLGLH